MLKQVFLHMNQERCNRKKEKYKREEKREGDSDKCLHGIWRSKYAIGFTISLSSMEYVPGRIVII